MNEEVDLVDPDKFVEHKAQIELEVEVEKKGLPIIQVERPPIPEITTNPPYWVKKISRVEGIEKPEDKLPPEVIKTEEEKLIENLGIKKRRNFFFNIIAKINRIFYRIWLVFKGREKVEKVEKGGIEEKESLFQPKRISISEFTEKDAEEFGRKRDYVRDEDGSGPIIVTMKNKNSGIVIVVPYYSHRSLEGFGEEWEVVENLIKE